MIVLQFFLILFRAIIFLFIKLWFIWLIPLVCYLIPYIYRYIKYKKSGYKGSSFYDIYIRNDNNSLGAYGEMLICNELNKIKDGRVLNNIYLYSVDGKSTEIDLLFIHPTGIYVIESKNFSGYIKGDIKYNQWLQILGRNKYKFANPINQNQKHIDYINNILEHKYDKNTYNIVVFSEKCTIGKINYNREEARVLKRENLIKVIKRIIEKTEPCMAIEQVEYLYHKFGYSNKVSQEEKLKHIENITGREDGVI